MKKGDRVRHWFAGAGTVRWVRGRSVFVCWDDGGNGMAYRWDCLPLRDAAPNS